MKYLKFYKRISLLALFFFFNVFVSKADVQITAFKIYPENLAPGGGLNVPNKDTSTPFKFHVNLSRVLRSTGGYDSGVCKFVLVYKDYSGATIDLASKDVTDADYNDVSGAPRSYAILPMSAELPQGKTNGSLYIRFTYYNVAQAKTLTENRTNESIPVVYVEPGPIELSDLVTYPSKAQPEIGVKLPGENLEFKWNASKLTSSTVNISLYDSDSRLIMVKSGVPNNGTAIFDFSSVQSSLNGVYNRLSFNATSTNSSWYSFYGHKFYIQIKEVNGTKFGNSRMFCFINDHPSLWVDDFPEQFIGIFPNSFWIFRPITNEGMGELTLDWISNRIQGANVSIDLYDKNGGFIKKLTASTPNNGHYFRAADASIPFGNQNFYQFKITSVEYPSQVGYSEPFHHRAD